MKKTDILIVYETKVRELESICLLKCELERRGLSVAIVNTWNEIFGEEKHRYKAKVVVTPSMYTDGIYDFVKSFCYNVPKVVNLQWEQIGPVGDRSKDDAWYILKGMAKQCVNICWGENTYNRLLKKAGIDEKHLCLGGHLALDFSRPVLSGYYESKESLLPRYGLPLDKKINLFISSFSYVNLPETLEKQSLFSEVDKFKLASVQSFQGVLQWFDRFLSSHDDQIIVYRPHPSEANNPALTDLRNKYPEKLFVISELSVKQWILVSDKVYTWYSTSSAEAYAFHKPIGILRPVEIPPECETELLEEATKITGYEEFEQSFYSDISSSLDSKVFEKYYDFGEVPSYIRVSDAIEQVYRDDAYLIHDMRKKERQKPMIVIKTGIVSFLTKLAAILPESWHFLDRFRKKKELDEYTLGRMKANEASKEEIDEICAKINDLIKKNTER